MKISEEEKRMGIEIFWKSIGQKFPTLKTDTDKNYE
jgi:hypothetical protein